MVALSLKITLSLHVAYPLPSLPRHDTSNTSFVNSYFSFREVPFTVKIGQCPLNVFHAQLALFLAEDAVRPHPVPALPTLPLPALPHPALPHPALPHPALIMSPR